MASRRPGVLAPVVGPTHHVNLWLSGTATATNCHYDANHNLLFVIRGHKTVLLWPPSATPALAPRHIHATNPNHSTLGMEELQEGARLAATGGVRVRACAGDVLYIPEGYWHQVESGAGTFAANVWFPGLRPQLCDRRMAPYYVRQLLDWMLHEEGAHAAALPPPPPPLPAEHAALSLDSLLLHGPPAALCARLRALPTPDVARCLPPLASAHPDAWQAFLKQHCDAATAAALAVSWERLEAEGSAVHSEVLPTDETRLRMVQLVGEHDKQRLRDMLRGLGVLE